VLSKIARGYRVTDADLDLAESTVASHIKSIYRKPRRGDPARNPHGPAETVAVTAPVTPRRRHRVANKPPAALRS